MIYITGTSGFIGGSVASWLVKKGFSIYPLTRENIFNRHIPLDGSHTLLHCAWEGVNGRFRNDELQNANVDLANRLIELSLELRFNRIIALGSQAEYGPANKQVDELTPLKPTTLYGEVKVKCGSLFERFTKENGLEYLWLRLFDPYGPGDGEDWFIPYLIQSALSNKSPELTDCTQIWDYLFIDDICRCLEMILSANNWNNGYYNLSSNKPVQLKKVVIDIFNLIRPETAKPLFGKRKFRSDQVFYLHGSNYKLQSNFGWEPEVDFEGGIFLTILYERYKKYKKETGINLTS